MAISPEGRYVVYVLREGEKQSLWVRQVATRSDVQVLAPDEVIFVFYLFAEAAGTIEVSAGGDEGILVLRHGFGNSEEISLRELERSAHAVGDRLGNVILLGGRFRSRFL